MARPDEILTQSRQESDKNDNDNTDEDGNAEATNERINHLVDYLEATTTSLKASSKSARLDLLSTIVDPQDCVQTVENFFDFAFLVKDKRIVQKYDNKKNTTQILVVDPAQMEDDGGFQSRKQMVLSLNMSDLKMIGDFETIISQDATPDVVESVLSMNMLSNTQDSCMSTSASVSSSNGSKKNATTTDDNKNNDDNTGGSGQKRKRRDSDSRSSSLSVPTSYMNIPNSCPLHRSDELYRLKDARSQAELLQKRANLHIKVK